MAEITLTAETGRPTGSRVSKRLVASGKVPGVVYGLGNDPVPVSVDWRELRAALTTDAGLNALIDLTLDGETKLSIVKDLQRDPIKHTVKHVDFLLIRRDQAITVDIPLVLEGEAEHVMKADGMVDQILVSLSISAKPADIPNEIVIDISGLKVGDTVRVGDLKLPAGVTTDTDPEDAILTASIASSTLESAEIEAADAEVAAEQSEEAAEEAAAEADGDGDGDGDAAEGDSEG